MCNERGAAVRMNTIGLAVTLAAVAVLALFVPANSATSFANHNGAGKSLPSPPAHIFQFELADAAVPSKETAQSIREGRARSLQQMASVASGPRAAPPQPEETSAAPPPRSRPAAKTRRGRTAAIGDLSAAESQIMQLRIPLALAMQKPTRSVEAGGAKGQMKPVREIPMEVQDVVRYVLKKSPLKLDPIGLYKLPNGQHQRYAKNNNIQNWWKLKQPVQQPKPAPVVSIPVQQYVPDINYNTIQASSAQHYVEDSNQVQSYQPEQLPSAHPAQPFQIYEVFDPTQQPSPDSPNPMDNWFLKQDVKEQAEQQQIIAQTWPEEQQPNHRPQDSTAPVLFPLGARLPLPKSNFSAAVVNKYQTLASIATPVVSSDYYYLPGEPKDLGLVDHVQQYHNDLDEASRSAEIPAYQEQPQPQQQFLPSALYYSPKDHTPIIEPTVEEESEQRQPPKLQVPGKPVYGFVPTTRIEAPVAPKVIYGLPAPNPVSYSKFSSSIDPKPINVHQYASGYQFGYRVRDVHTGNDFGHTQNRAADGVTHGEYHILLPDGRIQSVKYMADKKGFHADVRYNGAGGGGGGGGGGGSGGVGRGVHEASESGQYATKSADLLLVRRVDMATAADAAVGLEEARPVGGVGAPAAAPVVDTST